jgi:hypothetical protein
VKISVLFMPAKIILFFGTTHPKRYRAEIYIFTTLKHHFEGLYANIYREMYESLFLREQRNDVFTTRNVPHTGGERPT